MFECMDEIMSINHPNILEDQGKIVNVKSRIPGVRSFVLVNSPVLTSS